MNKDKAFALNASKDKADEEIQFVPNISSVEGDGLQLWMNALQSGKDVHCNLTTEDGYLTITLVDPLDNAGSTEEKKQSCSNDETRKLVRNFIENVVPEKKNRDERKTDSQSLVEWGLFQNNQGDIIAHPVHHVIPDDKLQLKSRNEDLDAPYKNVGTENGSQTLFVKSKEMLTEKTVCKIPAVLTSSTKEKQTHVLSQDSQKCQDSSKHTVIVTVSSDNTSNQEAEVSLDKYEPADPDVFPCIRSQWYLKAQGSTPDTIPSVDSCDINTTALAGDLRHFLRYHCIPLANFSKAYLERSQGTLSDLLNHPKPWNSLSVRGKSMYLKMMEFLNLQNLDTAVDELRQGLDQIRRGPITAKLPSYFTDMLAKKVMPPTKMLVKISQEYQLNLIYLKSFCVNQLKQFEGSFDVIVEFGDKKLSDKEDENSEERTTSLASETVQLESGFRPHSKGNLICPVLGCGFILRGRLTLQTHLLTHSGQKPHKCDHCEKTFRTLSNLRCHEKRHEKANKVSKRAQRAAMLRNRENASSKIADTIVGELSVDSESKTEEERLSEVEAPIRPKPVVKKFTYSCGVCSRDFPGRRSLQSHVTNYHVASVMHDSNRMFVCETCKKSFKTINALVTHQRMHNGEKPYICKFCSRRFSTNYGCIRHERTHSHTKPYKCSRCPTRFSDARYIETHMRLHTGEKPFACETCGKQFSQSSTLASHRLLHTDDFPYLCATCGKGFRQKTNLRSHERRHRAQRDYECETCGEAFVTKCDLQKHKWCHNSDHRFVCNKCSMSYSRLNYLTEHAHKVHNISPYKCEKCGGGFLTKSSFLKHQSSPCESQGSNRDDKKTDTEMASNDPNLQLLQVFSNAVCCLSSIPSNSEAELEQNPPLPVAMTTDGDPTFLPADQATSFSLNPESNMPVAIVTGRGFVLTSSSGVDSSLLDADVTDSNDNSFELLSKLPLPQNESMPSMQDVNDPNMQSAIVASEDCERLEERSSYVVASVSNQVNVLNNNIALDS